VLERNQRPRPEPANEADPSPVEIDPEGRGVASPSTSSGKKVKRDKKVKGRTIYLHDDLWERIIVQAHRKDLTISDYVADRLERNVPNHRAIGSGPSVVLSDDQEQRAIGSGPSVVLSDSADNQEAA
jgi:hypothetical protein